MTSPPLRRAVVNLLANGDTEAMGLVVTAIAATVTTLLGVVVGSILSSRSQSRQWSRDRHADACTLVLRESSSVMMELAGLGRLPVEPVPDGTYVPNTLDWRPWNEAIATISLVADHDIVHAALAIDAEFWRAHQRLRRGWLGEGGWPALRDPIDARRQDFINAARRHLARPGPPLHRLNGRPARDDPFWELRRSYFSADRSDSPEAGLPGQDQPEPSSVQSVSGLLASLDREPGVGVLGVSHSSCPSGLPVLMDMTLPSTSLASSRAPNDAITFCHQPPNG